MDNGKPFPLHLGKRNTMRAYGHLVLFVNDATPEDNYGLWELEIGQVR